MRKVKEGATIARNIVDNIHIFASPAYEKKKAVRATAEGLVDLFRYSRWTSRTMLGMSDRTVEDSWALLTQQMRYSDGSIGRPEIVQEMSQKVSAIGSVINRIHEVGEKESPYASLDIALGSRTMFFNDDLRRFHLDMDASSFVATMLTGALAQETLGDVQQITTNRQKTNEILGRYEKQLLTALGSHYGGLRRLTHRNVSVEDVISLYLDGSLPIPHIPHVKE